MMQQIGILANIILTVVFIIEYYKLKKQNAKLKIIIKKKEFLKTLFIEAFTDIQETQEGYKNYTKTLLNALIEKGLVEEAEGLEKAIEFIILYSEQIGEIRAAQHFNPGVSSIQIPLDWKCGPRFKWQEEGE
jgi:hypothetical protein